MSTATSHWNRVSRRPLADVLDELRTARTLSFDEHRDGILVMSVNRPHRANSQTIEMFGEIAWATAALRSAAVRALIVTGAGGKAFCTGFDLDQVDVLTRMSVSEFTDLVEIAAAGSTGLRALPYPVIAAVSGPAAGGGLSLALAADIRIIDHTASFSAGFVRIGLSIGELGTSWNLVRLIGPGRAGVFVNLVPVFGAIMAVVILGEPFALYHVLALLLVVGGIAIAQRSSAAAQR